MPDPAAPIVPRAAVPTIEAAAEVKNAAVITNATHHFPTLSMLPLIEDSAIVSDLG